MLFLNLLWYNQSAGGRLPPKNSFPLWHCDLVIVSNFSSASLTIKDLPEPACHLWRVTWLQLKCKLIEYYPTKNQTLQTKNLAVPLLRQARIVASFQLSFLFKTDPSTLSQLRLELSVDFVSYCPSSFCLRPLQKIFRRLGEELFSIFCQLFPC